MMPLLGQHGADDLVAFGEGGPKTARALQRDALTVAASLPASDGSSHVLLVFERDRYGLAAALLGAWQAGHAVMLPPDGRPQTIGALLQRSDVCALVHDTHAGGHRRIDDLLGADPPVDLRSGPIDPRATLFSADMGSEFSKSAAQLLGEVEHLASAFDFTGARFVVDAPPTDLHGFVVGILVPLCTGGAFSRAMAPTACELTQRCEHEQPGFWISVPSRVHAARSLPPGRLHPLRWIFTTATDLSQKVAEQLVREHGTGLVELLGLPDTGTIAWRRREDGECWRPLPNVHTSVDHDARLLVASPLVADKPSHPWLTPLLAEAKLDGTFVCPGRNDEVIERGDVRVFLAQIRQWLFEHARVEDAAATLVHPAHGEPLLLVAVLAPIADEAALRRELLERFGLVGMDCHLRVVTRTAFENSGVSRRSLLRYFGRDDQGHPRSTALDVRRAEHEHGHADAGVVARTVRVPEDYVHFEGHFDGYPILAGVVQLHELLLPLARQARPELGELHALQQLKFLGRICPGDEICVTLRFAGDDTTCDFSIERRGRRCSAGRLCFARAEVSRA